MSTELVKRNADEMSGTASSGREYAIGVVRGAIAAIPCVGTLLNEVLFDARARVKQQRLEAFAEPEKTK